MPTLEWIGKDKIVNHHMDVPFRVLQHKYSYDENGQHSEDNGSGNMIIHGDNLDALKALLPKYEGKIKCIYIDPPYNTGNENWVYNDNVNDPKIKKWLGEVVGREGEDLSRHDKWLCMMYPRLRLLQRLLAENGVIFISIDKNEVYHLKLICDEIFSSGNFITEIACVNKPSGRSDDKYIATAHESILIYRKSNLLILGGFEPDENITNRYTKTDEGGNLYREEDLRKRGSQDERKDRPNMFYPFFYSVDTNDLIIGNDGEKTPEGYIRIEPMKSKNVQGRWRWGRDTALNQKTYLHPRLMPNKNQWSMFEWEYLKERSSVKPTTLWDFKDVNSERGSETFIKFLGFNKSDFENPKPIGTIERIIHIATSPGDIILDSFAGSGTTAHAVLNVNKTDRGSRKFILVEMMDYAETTTAERVRRVIGGYADVEGTEGSFSFYELGEPILVLGKLNEKIDERKIREYVFYSETKIPITSDSIENSKHFLGKHNDVAYFFYYEKLNATTLDYGFLSTIKIEAEHYVIYADVNVLSNEEMKDLNITFKKIPRDIIRV